MVIWLVSATLTAWLAQMRGRGEVAWFIGGLVFGPVALVAVGLADRSTGSGAFVRCVECLEPIHAGATKCAFCGADQIEDGSDDDDGAVDDIEVPPGR